MTKIKNNPARRLHHILAECQKINGSMNGFDAWAKILIPSSRER